MSSEIKVDPSAVREAPVPTPESSRDQALRLEAEFRKNFGIALPGEPEADTPAVVEGRLA